VRVDAECDLHLRLQRQHADQDGFDRHNKLHLELREPFNADHTAGCPYNKIVLFNVDSIGLEALSRSQPLITRRVPQARILNLGLGLPLPFTKGAS
jgi:hypothetical protein